MRQYGPELDTSTNISADIHPSLCTSSPFFFRNIPSFRWERGRPSIFADWLLALTSRVSLSSLCPYRVLYHPLRQTPAINIPRRYAAENNAGSISDFHDSAVRCGKDKKIKKTRAGNPELSQDSLFVILPWQPWPLLFLHTVLQTPYSFLSPSFSLPPINRPVLAHEARRVPPAEPSRARLPLPPQTQSC
jgi:hypothetical protein